MKSNIEIEFKTKISEKEYLGLIDSFDLEDNIFKQTNYYFDTDDFKLNQSHTVVRIRARGDNHIKITSKKQSGVGAFEQHVLIDKIKAEKMIQHGFNLSEFFDDDLKVTFKASLDNYRVSTPYKNGTLFFDKSVYNEMTDYEIEYEVDDFNKGQKEFTTLLNSLKLTQTETLRKSERALAHLIKS